VAVNHTPIVTFAKDLITFGQGRLLARMARRRGGRPVGRQSDPSW
jgi:hypothetical protein